MSSESLPALSSPLPPLKNSQGTGRRPGGQPTSQATQRSRGCPWSGSPAPATPTPAAWSTRRGGCGSASRGCTSCTRGCCSAARPATPSSWHTWCTRGTRPPRAAWCSWRTGPPTSARATGCGPAAATWALSSGSGRWTACMSTSPKSPWSTLRSPRLSLVCLSFEVERGWQALHTHTAPHGCVRAESCLGTTKPTRNHVWASARGDPSNGKAPGLCCTSMNRIARVLLTKNPTNSECSVLQTLLELTTCCLRRWWGLLLPVVAQPCWGQLGVLRRCLGGAMTPQWCGMSSVTSCSP